MKRACTQAFTKIDELKINETINKINSFELKYGMRVLPPSRDKLCDLLK